MEPPEGSEPLDPWYFSSSSWSDRRESWVRRASRGGPFATGNDNVVQEAVSDDECGLRVVLNLGVHALLRLLPEGRYLNLYERPVIGGEPMSESVDRQTVDGLFGLDGRDTYFAAVALGGAGVRFYGEYCLVLRLEEIDDDPQLCDRDSYDILLPPFPSGGRLEAVRTIVGRWRADRHDMVALKVLPEVTHLRNLVTAGTISELVLKDQEFIEVHLNPRKDAVDPQPGGFGSEGVMEVRQSPDEVAVATRIGQREQFGELLPAVEDEWLLRRECADRVIARAGLPARVVTTHGRGYQWK